MSTWNTGELDDDELLSLHSVKKYIHGELLKGFIKNMYEVRLKAAFLRVNTVQVADKLV